MQFRPLGRTGFRVSIVGLGTGSRFGDLRNQTQEEATRLVRGALDLGVNYIDTAPMYLEAEAMLGTALAGVPRERFAVATKVFPVNPAGMPITPAQLRESVERSLARLRLETIDILQLHGLRAHWIDPVLTSLGSELGALRREGKFRFLGVTETIVEDPRHEMVPLLSSRHPLDTALVAYSLLSPWAELTALPACRARDIGVVGMVAVRRALRDSELLNSVLTAGRARGEPGILELPSHRPLDWLLDEHSPTLVAAGYRFAVAHPAVSCVLSGTLKIEHVRQNIAAVCAPPMADEQVARIRRVFLRTNPERWTTYTL